MLPSPPISPQRPLACVTGASSGIGASYARLLARMGYDLLIVARRKALLLALAEEIRREFGAAVEAFTADLAAESGLLALETRLAGLPALEVLVNNAGLGSAGFFWESEITRQEEMVRLHALASVRLSRAALTSMLPAGRGTIVNLSSISSFFCFPTNAVYGATKAFVNSFTESLAYELAGTGVYAQVLCPGLTRTELHDELDFNTHVFPRFVWMSSERVVAASWHAVQKRHFYCIPGLVNQVSYYLSRLLPRGLLRAAMPLLQRVLISQLRRRPAL